MTDVIAQHLDVWISAIASKATAGRGTSDKQTAYGIKKLRDLILELAVLGKLVSQDPNDTPARELLKKIESEKQGFIKAGKFKAPKTTSDIEPNEVPYILPIGWEWIKLGNCSQIERGGSPRPIEAYLTNDVDGLNWIKIGDTQKGCKFITSTREKIKKEGLVKTRMVYPGDFLLTNSMSFGRPYISMIEGCIHDGWLRIHPPALLDKDYLYNLLQSPYVTRFFAKAAAGAVVQNLNADKVRELLIALPPFEEQKRIAAKVDELMALCDQLEQHQTDIIAAHQTLVQTLLETLTQAADAAEFEQAWSRIADHFDTLFTTEPSIGQLKQTLLQLAVMGKLVPQNHNGESARLFLENIFKEKKQLVDQGIIRTQKAFPQIEAAEKLQNIPASWELSRLGEFTIVGTGSTPSRDKASYYFPPEVNWVTSGETSQNFIFETNEKISKIALKETNVSVYPIGTLIIAMYGQGKTRGQVSELMIEAGTNQACAAVVCVNKELAHRRFIKLFFMKAYEELRSHSAGGAQPNLNLAKISNTVIPIPPLEEQNRIVAKVDELMALCDALKARIAAAQTTQLQLADAIVEQAVA